MNENFRGIKSNLPIYFDLDWIDNDMLEKILNGFNEGKNMTLDELLEAVSPEVKEAIVEICERAGTYDANWEVLKAAGELIARYKEKDEHYFTLNLTEAEHNIVENELRKLCDKKGLELIYYRKMVDHIPMFREIEIKGNITSVYSCFEQLGLMENIMPC